MIKKNFSAKRIQLLLSLNGDDDGICHDSTAVQMKHLSERGTFGLHYGNSGGQ